MSKKKVLKLVALTASVVALSAILYKKLRGKKKEKTNNFLDDYDEDEDFDEWLLNDDYEYITTNHFSWEIVDSYAIHVYETKKVYFVYTLKSGKYYKTVIFEKIESNPVNDEHITRCIGLVITNVSDRERVLESASDLLGVKFTPHMYKSETLPDFTDLVDEEFEFLEEVFQSKGLIKNESEYSDLFRNEEKFKDNIINNAGILAYQDNYKYIERALNLKEFHIFETAFKK